MPRSIDDQVRAMGAKLLLLRTANECRLMGLQVGPDVPGHYVLVEDDYRPLAKPKMRGFDDRTGFLWEAPHGEGR